MRVPAPFAAPGNGFPPAAVFTGMSSHPLTLPGGIRFGVRPIDGDDKPGIAAFFQGLSDESRRRRFLGPKPKLTSRDLAFLTDVDQRSHVAIAAHDDAGAIVGVARYAAWPDRPGVAEIAFAVVDAWHGRGIATALATQLVERARADGLTALTASTLTENQPARALLVNLGFRPLRTSAGVVDYELRLAAAAA